MNTCTTSSIAAPFSDTDNTGNTGEIEAAKRFKALGDPTRLRIFLFLCSCTCCPVAVGEDGAVRPVEGPTVGEICCHITGIERITSTLSEHLKELRAAGLIVTEKRGRHVVCSVPPSVPTALSAFFSASIPSLKEADGSNGCGCNEPAPQSGGANTEIE